ncbi:MAG: AraC family transcriptional regulator [bacterium]
METAEKFLLEQFLDNGSDVFHLARTTISSGDSLSMHYHNYAEVFWIKSGQGIHCINGEEIKIQKGTLCMIRPQDKHTFKVTPDDQPLVITNIAFSHKILDYFKVRYFPGSDTYFWLKENLPFCTRLKTDHLNELSARIDQLFAEPRDYLQLDYILITLFRLIDSLEIKQNDIPAWLIYAMNNYDTPEQFLKGISGFVELTGHSTAHVNRTLRKHLKQTLTETVIRIRINYASQQLIMTNASVKSICADCGFRSLSYFYRLFNKYTGHTPVDYRKKNHKIF